jgi:hypothetical protein
MCRSLRASFEQCAKATAEDNTQMVGDLAEQLCGHVENQDDKMFCAARLVNQQLLQGYYPPAQQQ